MFVVINFMYKTPIFTNERNIIYRTYSVESVLVLCDRCNYVLDVMGHPILPIIASNDYQRERVFS